MHAYLKKNTVDPRQRNKNYTDKQLFMFIDFSIDLETQRTLFTQLQ